MTKPKKKDDGVKPTGRCYAYLRVSRKHQGASGLGIEAQDRACLATAKRMKLEWGIESHDSDGRFGYFVDIGESAYRTSFSKRPGGAKLLETVQPGDTVIAAKMCRLFRSMSDFVYTGGKLAKMGVRLVLCNPSIDTASASGVAFAQVLAAFAEWESRRKGERIRAALESKRIRELAAKMTQEAPVDEDEDSLDSDWRPAEKLSPVDPWLPRNGRVHYYMRVSHRDSAFSGNGILAQSRKSQEHLEYIMARNPNLSPGEQFVDLIVSASKLPFCKRQGGMKAIHAAKPGDHVVFSCLDRAFRDLGDLTYQLGVWAKKGVTVHFVEEGIDTSDLGGRMMTHFAGMFAEYEAELIAQRCREARAENASRGRFCGGHEPSFWKVYKYNRTKRLVVVKRHIACFRLINIYRSQGLSIKAACERMEAIIAKRENRSAIPQTGARQFSNIIKGLPRDYPRDKRGFAFPSWTTRRYQRCQGSYEAAVLAWKKTKQIKRQAMSTFGPESPPKKRKVNYRGWPIGDNPPNEKRKDFPSGELFDE